MKNYLLILVFAVLKMTSCSAQKSALSNFVPQGYSIYETHFADLNNDQQDDCILL